MTIAIVHIQDGVLQSIVTDDDDLQVVLIDEDDQAEEPEIRRFYETTVDLKQASEVWQEIAKAETED